MLKSLRSWALACASTAALAVVGAVSPSFAQQAAVAAETSRAFNIPAGALPAALNRFASETGLALVYPAELARGRRTAGLSGSYLPSVGLTRLLAGTNLTYRFTDASTVVIEETAGMDSQPRVLGPVRVEGASSTGATAGFNGSTDATATEGTGSYTSGALSIGSKAPQSMKDTPQSVSVLTQQRMQDQNITDFTEALNQLPGVSVIRGGGSSSSSIDSTFVSRGYQITAIQIDGGPPLLNGTMFNESWRAYNPQVDMSQYDHVELLRGADGLFNFYGTPGGSVNLVRKRPLDHGQVAWELETGSWDWRRTSLDVTSPLAFDGALRGRLVLTHQDNDHFYKVAQDEKSLAYGTLEYDLTPSTVLSGGLSYTQQDSVPWFGGLPRYESGADLGLSRDFCLCFPWNKWNYTTTEVFAGVEQKLGDHWQAKLNLTRNEQQTRQNYGTSTQTVSPITNRGPIMYGGAETDRNLFSSLAEITLAGSFDILGQRQEILLGGSYAKTDSRDEKRYTSRVSTSYVPYVGAPVGRPAINIFSFNPYDPLYADPGMGLLSAFYPSASQTTSGAYLSVKLTAFDRLHFITGVRYSHFEREATSVALCTDFTGSCKNLHIGDVWSASDWSGGGHDISWPPTLSLVFDLNKALSVYASYTDIYVNQENYLDEQLNGLPPGTGSNMEVGIKWEALGGKLNSSFAAYRIEQKNSPVSTGTYGPWESNYGRSPDLFHVCCYAIAPDWMGIGLSQGADAEVTGEILPGWQLSASYTWNKNELSGRALGSYNGTPLESRAPQNLYKIWSSYRFKGDGWWNRLTLSGGLNGQSSAFQAGSACTVYNAPNPTTGAVTCKTTTPYSYTQKAYAVLSARIDYRLTNTWDLAVNGNNLTDKVYYQTMGGSTGGNWYGDPRNVMVSLHGKF
ncbi:MAG: TonB-dependent siderophore receptor [Gammaproteobacteria bacterium]